MLPTLNAVPQSSRFDPSRTLRLRTQYVRGVRSRFAELQKDILSLLLIEDAFGLKSRSDVSSLRGVDLLANTRWQFDTDAAKVQQFRQWLDAKTKEGVLGFEMGPEGSPDVWSSGFVHSAYRQGLNRGYIDSKPNLKKAAGFIEGSQAEFLNQAFNQPETLSKIQSIYTRNYSNLRGMTDDMANKLTQTLAKGLAEGRNPNDIARTIRKQLNISKHRATVIARTEIIHAHAEGQLDAFELLGVDDVGIMAEWHTAGDSRVCELCGALESVVMTVKEARGLIPRHPQCRCAWKPANIGENPKGQKRGKKAAAAVDKSIGLERPGKKLSTAKKKSTWSGAGKKITGKRPKAVPQWKLDKKKGASRIKTGKGKKGASQFKSGILDAKPGSQAYAIEASMSSTIPRTPKELAQMTGIAKARVDAHMTYMVKKGLATKTPNGYLIGVEISPVSPLKPVVPVIQPKPIKPKPSVIPFGPARPVKIPKSDIDDALAAVTGKPQPGVTTIPGLTYSGQLNASDPMSLLGEEIRQYIDKLDRASLSTVEAMRSVGDFVRSKVDDMMLADNAIRDRLEAEIKTAAALYGSKLQELEDKRKAFYLKYQNAMPSREDAEIWQALDKERWALMDKIDSPKRALRDHDKQAIATRSRLTRDILKKTRDVGNKKVAVDWAASTSTKKSINLQKARDVFDDYLPADWTKDIAQQRIAYRGRGAYSNYDKMVYSDGTLNTMLHEIMHRIEQNYYSKGPWKQNSLLDVENVFFHLKTKNDTRRLIQGARGEYCKRDGFPEDYMGRIYDHSDAKEILTRAIEEVLGGTRVGDGVYDTDRATYDFMVGILFAY